MHGAQEFLGNLALVLCVAAVTTIVCQRLRQPVVLGYIVAGLIIGPHVPIPLVADREIIETLAELGVILLMFSLGLEFSLRKLLRLGASATLIGLLQISVMIWLGILTGRVFGWTPLESLFTGAVIAISSTTIIAKAFNEQRVGGRTREIVFGVLIVEDLAAVLMLAVLAAVASGTGASAAVVMRTAGELLGFLAGAVLLGLLLVPRLIRSVVSLGRAETTLVASVGVCFAASLLAARFGYSVALGAFLAGSLIAESGAGPEVERRIEPVRDMFAALFFVSVGMLIDPALVQQNWAAVVALTGVVVAGKLVSVALGALLTGHGTRTSIEAGMSMAQIGEFSYLIAGLGRSIGGVGDFLYPVAVAVSGTTTLLTPWLIRASGFVASFVDRALPGPLQTFLALYGSWIGRLGSTSRSGSSQKGKRRVISLLLTDALLLAGLIIGTALGAESLSTRLSERLGFEPALSHALVLVAAAALAAPLGLGVVRLSRRLGLLLADAALPRSAAENQLAVVPRRALVLAVQLATLLAIAFPLVALTQPFLPSLPGAILLAALIGVLAVALWRSTATLEGHVRAGAQLIGELLTKQSDRTSSPIDARGIEIVRETLAGLGDPVRVEVDPTSRAVGKTLQALDLRARSGAVVLAITRGDQSIAFPGGGEVLRAGDVLAVAGSDHAIDVARRLLSIRSAPSALIDSAPDE